MNFPDQLSRLKSFWTKMPEQTKRLSVLLVILVALFIPARSLLIPKDFGKIGHYRPSALEENAGQDIRYAGQTICYDCHDDAVEVRNEGYHRDLSCEICHGPAAAHAEDPDVTDLRVPRDRGYCPLCHEYLASRPTGFPQIVSASHNPLKPCVACHNPHDPVPPEMPQQCEACHAAIARTKAVSHHVYIPCVRCHEAPEEHRVNPRAYRPSKPMTRDFCGECHFEDAPNASEITKVDEATHGARYVCWQCHYPHLPEAR